MTALTQDRNTKQAIGDLQVYKVAASTKIFAGSNVCRNTSGYAVPGADTAGLEVLGRAEEQVDNSAGANGDKTIKVKRGIFEFTGSGFSIADIGKEVYVADDQTVALRTTNSVYAGCLHWVESATSVYVDMRGFNAPREFVIRHKIAGATAGNYDDFFIAPFACELIKAQEVHDAAGTDAGAVTCSVEKLTGTQTPDGGVEMLQTALSLKATANTVQDGTLSTTVANRQLAKGDRVGLKDSGVLIAVGDVIVALTFRRL